MKPLRMLPLWLVAALCAQAALAAEPEAAASAGALLITNARIVDGTGAPPLTGAVRIAAGRIDAVGDLEPGANDRVVDTGGLTLTPLPETGETVIGTSMDERDIVALLK